MAFGTPGGDQQDQWSPAFFLRHAVHGMNLQEAIDAPAWHVDHFPLRSGRARRRSTASRSNRAFRADDRSTQLRDAGHDVRVGEPGRKAACRPAAASATRSGRLVLRAAANPRGMQGYAVGR